MLRFFGLSMMFTEFPMTTHNCFEILSLGSTYIVLNQHIFSPQKCSSVAVVKTYCDYITTPTHQDEQRELRECEKLEARRRTLEYAGEAKRGTLREVWTQVIE